MSMCITKQLKIAHKKSGLDSLTLAFYCGVKFQGEAVPEFKILNHVIDYMEATGSTYKLVTLSVDQELVDQINEQNKTSYTLTELEKATDKCLAHEWLEHATMGGGKYGSLRITPKGVGAARSKRKSEEQKASRGPLKKASDYVEDHKGLFVVLGFLLALATLSLKIFEG